MSTSTGRAGSSATVPDTGVQAERTALSWTRTWLGFLVNGVLLLVRHTHPSAVELTLAGATVLIAAAVTVVARRRSSALGRQPLPSPLAAPRAIAAAGGAVLALCLAASVSLLL